MYIESVPNRSSPPAVLLRESWREGGRVRKRTIANLTKWPPALVEGLRCLLKGGTAVPRLEDAVDIVRSLPHGHVAAVLGTLGKLGLETLIDPKPSPRRDQALAMIVARILEPALRLATARGLAEATATTTLGEILDADLGEDGLYAAMDWLLERQERIERGLAERHLEEGCPVLYDLTSVWMEGRSCPPGQTWPLPGRKEGQAADRVRPAVQPGRMSGVGGGVPRKHGGSGHARVTDRHGAGAVLALEGGAGGGPGDADRGADPGGGEACGAGLDQRPAGTGHPRPGGGRRH